MRGEVPIKYVLRGDREAGKLYMRRGAVLMDMLVHGMTYQGLKQSVMRRWVTPDVLIECDCRFGLRTVTITIAPVTPETIVTQQEDVFYGVVVAVFCSSGLFLHHGSWNGRPFSDGRLQYGANVKPPDWYDWGNARMYWRMVGWSAYPEGLRLKTKPSMFADTWYNFWVLNQSNGERRPDGKYLWNAPALMPGFTGKDYFLAYNIMYDHDDDRIVYHPNDYQRLTEIILQNRKDDGRQALTTKWMYTFRGQSRWVCGNGAVYHVSPMPERNGIRRFIAAAATGSIDGTAPCVHISCRGANNIRVFNFPTSLVSSAFPAEYDFNDRDSAKLYDFSSYMDADGKIHMLCCWRGGMRNGTDEEANTDEATVKWSSALVFITLPDLPVTLASNEAENAYLVENMTVRAIPFSDYLPLLDLLHPGGHEGLKALPGGTKAFVSGVAVLLYFIESPDRDLVQYVVDGTTYNPGGRPWNPADNVDIWGQRNWEGIVVNFDAALDVLGYCVGGGGGMPIDAVYFHGGDEHQWFSWSRMFGGLSITIGQGMRRIAMTWPDETATDGMKPDVTWAGNGLYCCVCFDTCKRRVVNVYIGTPFGTAERAAWWIKLPLITDEWRAVAGNAIMHIRPALATLERVVLLAVVKTGNIYRAAYCDGPPESAVLEFHGVIPLGWEEEIGERDESFMSFDICEYGEEGFADLLKVYPSPPRAEDAKGYSDIYLYKDNRDMGWTGEWTWTW